MNGYICCVCADMCKYINVVCANAYVYCVHRLMCEYMCFVCVCEYILVYM